MARLEAHYETIRDRHGYDRATGIDRLSSLERRFVAVDDREAVAAALERPTIACMGVGMTGPPHLGTVGQILTGIELQEAGLDVQFVIADLEPYHGGADWDRVRTLAERYRQFALDLGFDPDQGALRTQYERTDVMATAYRLAPYYRPEKWDDGEDWSDTEWERAVVEAYDSASEADGDADGDGDDESDEEAGPTSEAASVHSAVLHGADFIHPLTRGYEQVIVALGLDEHGLTPWTRQFLDATPVEGRVAGLHSRMIPGFGDAPKMSKSIGVGVSLEMAPAEIREGMMEALDGDSPATSTVFQAMCLASRYDAVELEQLEALCAGGGEEWKRAQREYVDYVVDLAELWKATVE